MENSQWLTANSSTVSMYVHTYTYTRSLYEVPCNRRSYYSESDDDIPSMQQPQAEVSEGLSTTTFEITNQATIPSDNASHKVTNCLIVGLNYVPMIFRCQLEQ